MYLYSGLLFHVALPLRSVRDPFKLGKRGRSGQGLFLKRDKEPKRSGTLKMRWSWGSDEISSGQNGTVVKTLMDANHGEKCLRTFPLSHGSLFQSEGPFIANKVPAWIRRQFDRASWSSILGSAKLYEDRHTDMTSHSHVGAEMLFTSSINVLSTKDKGEVGLWIRQLAQQIIQALHLDHLLPHMSVSCMQMINSARITS